MKKVVTFLLFASSLLSASAAVRGDVTGNNTVDIADVNEVINVMLGKATNPLADVTADGTVDIADVNMVINIMLGKDVPEPQLPTHYTVNGVEFDMVNVEGGTFIMGATDEQTSYALECEFPAHQVTLSSFQIGMTEVTQELWLAVMGTNPSRFTGDLQCPVEYVKWIDCQEFINKLNELTGAHFRLPTEAEWEFAARGGNQSNGYRYAGSNNLSQVAWYKSNSSSKTHPVGKKAPNELGIYDMSGNVWEWCNDWYAGVYPDEAQTNPAGPDSNEWDCKVYRGGGWEKEATFCRVSARANGSYNGFFSKYNFLGLRLAQ